MDAITSRDRPSLSTARCIWRLAGISRNWRRLAMRIGSASATRFGAATKKIRLSARFDLRANHGLIQAHESQGMEQARPHVRKERVRYHARRDGQPVAWVGVAGAAAEGCDAGRSRLRDRDVHPALWRKVR